MTIQEDLAWTGNKFLDFCITLIVALLVTAFAIVLIKGIFNLVTPQPQPEPTDMSFMLVPYLGLPFIFWFFSGFGLMFGLIFNGFKIITVNSSSDSHNTTTEKHIENVIEDKTKRKRK